MRAVLFLVFVVASALGLNLDVSSRGTTIQVNVAQKNSSHPYFGQGNPNGYLLNGIQGPTLILTAGQKYTFTLNQLCNHPIYFTTDASGQGILIGNSFDVTDGVVSSDYNTSCIGQTLSWTPPASFIGRSLFYQCRTHSKMGYVVQIKGPTICNKYSEALNMTNEDLIRFVVNAVVGIVTQTTHPLRGYFDGTDPPGSTDFTSASNAAALRTLIDHLVQFFGVALGCTDPAFPPYPANRPSLLTVHQPMNLDQFEFDSFNNVLLGVLRGAGMSDLDLGLVLSVLRSTKPQICTVGQCALRTSICDRYSDALNLTNTDLLRTLVVATFGGLISSPLRPYFDGTVNGTTVNYITNTNAQAGLVASLVAFFGQAAVLRCTDSGFLPYTGQNMRDAHRSFKVGPGEFNTFNMILLSVLTTAGVSAADVAAISSVLESTRGDICNNCGGSTDPVPVRTFVLQVVPKSNHPWTDGNVNVGFQVDGTEGASITLQPGSLYAFQNSEPACRHPVYISTSDQGASLGEITAGVAYPGNNPLQSCQGRILYFTPSQSQVGQQLYYQCQFHTRMGGPIFIGASPTTSAGSGTSGTQAATGTSTGEPLVPSIAHYAVPGLLLVALCLFSLLAF